MYEEIPRAQPPPEGTVRDADPLPARRWRLWRWRDNPLRRPVDRLQAWLGVAVTALTLTTAPLAILLTGKEVEHELRTTAHDQATSRHRTTAVLTHDAPQHPEPGSDEAEYARYPATVRYTDVHGRKHTGTAEVPAGLPAGGTVRVWSDDKGNLTGPPMTEERVRNRTFGAMAVAGLTTALAGVAVYGAICLALTRRSLSRWEEAWDATGPLWSRSP